MQTEAEREQAEIDAATRIESIVRDEAFQSVIKTIAEENYDDFKKAKSQDEIGIAHANGVALDKLMTKFQIVVDRGAAAKLQRNSRERRELAEADIKRNRDASIARRQQNAG